MIKAMNKYAFLIYHREYEEFLRLLQSLGVVHISRKRKPQDENELMIILEERLTIKQLKQQLKQFLPQEGSDALASVEDNGAPIVKQVQDALLKLDNLQDALEGAKAKVQEQVRWGEYDPEYLARLKEKGYELVGYSVQSSSYTEDYKAKYGAVDVVREGVLQFFVRLEQAGDSACPDAERHTIPTSRLSELQADVERQEQGIADYLLEMESLSSDFVQRLDAYDAELEDKFAFGAALLQGEKRADDRLIFLEGWTPRENAQALEAQLSSGGYYYQNCPIEEQDNVPISLKNNVFSRGFELITKMFSLPNYQEIDQTALFAPFFMLFFGLCVGDAGYGLIIFCVATYLHIKAKAGDDTTAYELMQWLGGGAFVIGLLMGSLFGVVLPYADHKDYFLNQDNLMILSVIVGLLQILFGKGVAAYKIKIQKGTKYSIAPFAWIVFLIGIGLMLGIPYLGVALPEVVKYIIYGVVGISTLIILFYNSPGKNPFLNVASALWKTYETASGLLGDTLSYIRLFAIGLTGAVLGGVFNSLAVEQTASLPIAVRFPLMLVILLAGHSINIALAIIGALVHPIRLTFVEYYKNSEFEGGGVAYDPLKHSKTVEKK